MKVAKPALRLFLALLVTACIAFLPAAAQETTSREALLATGDPQAGVLAPGQSKKYLIRLNAEDLARCTLVTSDIATSATVVDPSSTAVRAVIDATEDGLTRTVNFVGKVAGVYQVEVKNSSRGSSSTYQFKLDLIVTPQERSKPVAIPTLEGTPIRQLREALHGDRASGLRAFWENVRARGTPLVEPSPGDARFDLVTFVWQGNETTRNVMVYQYDIPSDLYDDAQTDNARRMMTRVAGTDVWHATLKIRKNARFRYRLAVNAPVFPTTVPIPGVVSVDNDRRNFFDATLRADPLNPRLLRNVSVVELPGAPAQPWIARREHVPSGVLNTELFKSRLLHNERRISVYTPPGYSRTKGPYRLVLFLDGDDYLSAIPTPTILDNMLAAGRLPPLIAVFVGNGPGYEQDYSRNRELPCNPRFADFLNAELIAWVRNSYSVTANPKLTIIGGLSFGGLAATCTALRHPETFGNVL